MFFNSEKLKVKSEASDKSTKFSIDYYKIKDKDGFKLKIISDLIGNDLCLAILDTKLQYSEAKQSVEEFVSILEQLQVPYKKIVIKGEENLKVLGIVMKAPGGKRIIGNIVGFVIKAEKLNELNVILDSYNIYFCIDGKCNKYEELLDCLQKYYEDGEESMEGYQITVFNSNAFNKMTIKTSCNKVEYVNGVINQHKNGAV